MPPMYPRVCETCGVEFLGWQRSRQCVGCRPVVYEPTPEEIAVAAAAIRDGWTDADGVILPLQSPPTIC
jgi:hypothetical protein